MYATCVSLFIAMAVCRCFYFYQIWIVVQAITKMKADFEEEKQKGTTGLTSEELSLEFMELDLSSLKSTQKFIEEFKASGKPLHVLLCNAGLGMLPLGRWYQKRSSDLPEVDGIQTKIVYAISCPFPLNLYFSAYTEDGNEMMFQVGLSL